MVLTAWRTFHAKIFVELAETFQQEFEHRHF